MNSNVQYQGLSSRAVIGMFWERLQQNVGAAWLSGISGEPFTSDQASEIYPFLGQVPTMREWVGDRSIDSLLENVFTVVNTHYEAGLGIPLASMRRDKTGQIRGRVNELADRGDAHWAKLVMSLINAGESGVCYDGQFFFDTDHVEGASGAQSNDISIDISALPASAAGSTTQPSISQMRYVIMKTIEQIAQFVDDQGEPVNELAREFTVMTPVPLWATARAAVGLPTGEGGDANVFASVDGDFQVRVRTSPRLTWTDKIATFRTDANQSAIIRQEETPIMLDVLDENSEHAVKHKELFFGIDTWRAAAYGDWRKACLGTMT